MNTVLVVTDWTPVVLAIAGAISLLAVAVANFIQTRSNGSKIEATHTAVNGGMSDLQQRVAALELAARDVPRISARTGGGIDGSNTDPAAGSGTTAPGAP